MSMHVKFEDCKILNITLLERAIKFFEGARLVYTLGHRAGSIDLSSNPIIQANVRSQWGHSLRLTFVSESGYYEAPQFDVAGAVTNGYFAVSGDGDADKLPFLEKVVGKLGVTLARFYFREISRVEIAAMYPNAAIEDSETIVDGLRIPSIRAYDENYTDATGSAYAYA